MNGVYKKDRARTALKKVQDVITTNPWDTAKVVVIWGGVAVTAYLVLRIVKKLTREPDDSAKAAKDQVKKTNLTYYEAQYAIWADMIEQAMYEAGTNFETILAIFEKMKTDDDLLMLIIKFDVRKNSWFYIPTGSGTLAIWLQDDLTTSELAQLNEILKSKNINIQF